MKAYIFPGQGSQSKGMGGELFDEFDHYTRTADDILGYSIKSLCLDDAQRQLNDTRYTQPALFTVNTLSYLKALQDDPSPPSCVAGHSLGEYSALLAAGAFRFDVGLAIVKKRAELMSDAPAGGMAAVLDCALDTLKGCLQDAGVDGIDIANYNADSQIVIAGARTELAAAFAAFDERDVRYVPLRVSAAFHSRHMAPLKDAFRAFLSGIEFRPLRVPVVSNLDGALYRDDDLIERLSAQLCGSVMWRDSVLRMRALGVTHFIEVGPGDVLTKLNGKIA
ncbi:ACP S-malonyltransferase [Burkholderia singularis]|uniref:Malonyl CoA-acyl carrier protein transacylase n=1 Tax=Burkholderia singularis TaxID=1503053 RepID=A0A238H4L3_9BURK|nr:ACP S-malonyltransferase [Burkholderia singularis]SMG00105.1 Malonyl CoA-acyl carrier protein transacylase [Burkholderia singularis]